MSNSKALVQKNEFVMKNKKEEIQIHLDEK